MKGGEGRRGNGEVAAAVTEFLIQRMKIHIIKAHGFKNRFGIGFRLCQKLTQQRNSSKNWTKTDFHLKFITYNYQLSIRGKEINIF
jgi:hypothetical protein